MSDAVSPFPTWLTYPQVAERLGLRTANTAAAKARRAKWPMRTRNDTLEIEVCVPADVLVAGPPQAKEPDGDSLQTTAETVAAAVAPLQGIIESLSEELNAAHRSLAAAQAEGAEFKGRSDALEAGLEQARAERRELQQQVDHVRREYQSVQERVVLAQGEALEERRRRHSTEDLLARLKHELSDLKQASDRRRWWRR